MGVREGSYIAVHTDVENGGIYLLIKPTLLCFQLHFQKCLVLPKFWIFEESARQTEFISAFLHWGLRIQLFETLKKLKLVSNHPSVSSLQNFVTITTSTVFLRLMGVYIFKNSFDGDFRLLGIWTEINECIKSAIFNWTWNMNRYICQAGGIVNKTQEGIKQSGLFNTSFQ